MYLTYDEYDELSGGENTLDETIFNDLYFRVESEINWYTFNRFKNDTEFPEELKRLVIRLIQMLSVSNSLLGIASDNDGVSNIGVASQSNDGVSVSYNRMNASDLYGLIGEGGSAIEKTIKKYLNGVRNQKGRLVLYRGIYCDE